MQRVMQMYWDVPAPWELTDEQPMNSYDTTGPMDQQRTKRLLGTLADYVGGDARIVALTESHSMLVVRLSLATREVTLMFGDCSRIESNVRWTVGRFEYEVIASAPHRYQLRDARSAFRVDCGVILIADKPDDWKRTESEA